MPFTWAQFWEVCQQGGAALGCVALVLYYLERRENKRLNGWISTEMLKILTSTVGVITEANASSRANTAVLDKLVDQTNDLERQLEDARE